MAASPDSYKIALLGNPNSGKSSLFNALTGLNQQVGNFSGVTVDRFSGIWKTRNHGSHQLIDLPGVYSLHPKSIGEHVVREVLLDKNHEDHPDLIIYVLDASNLKRNLLLATQLIDLDIPFHIALTMNDIAHDEGYSIDTKALKESLGVEVVSINPRSNQGVESIEDLINTRPSTTSIEPFGIPSSMHALLPNKTRYEAFLHLTNIYSNSWLNAEEQKKMQQLTENERNAFKQLKTSDIEARYVWIGEKLEQFIIPHSAERKAQRKSNQVDKVLTHPIWGGIALVGIFFLVFQSLFFLASFPMDGIDYLMGGLIELTAESLPSGLFSDFIVEGVLSGIAGIVIFLPQIMILFGLITILEDTGYMARVSFINDRLFRYFGMNGKSTIPIVGGFACAVPAIMAARNIESRRERLITMFITPLMSCSARLPVYVFLIAFVIPVSASWGPFGLQGLVMLGLYLLGLVSAFPIAYIMNQFLKDSTEQEVFVLELPKYKWPNLKLIGTTMLGKGKVFLIDAGKIIMLVSIALWFLSSFGPQKQREAIHNQYAAEIEAADSSTNQASADALILDKEAALLEASYAGILGKTIEPVMEPLGMDWRMSIAVITSFAAREVFVGSMSTIYAIDSENAGIGALQDKLAKETNPKTGKPLLNRANSVAILLFFVFAMQCMSTMAIMRRETGGWIWPILQFIVFGGIAYLSGFAAYYILS